MLEIKNLQVKVAGKEILKGIDLSIGSGEVHAVMGPNGSGKTTLAQVLAGRLAYEVTGGTARFQGKDLLAMKPEDRAREGVFMAFQYPVEIPGVSNAYFLKAALNAIRKYRGLEEIDAMDFMGLVQDKAKLLGLDETFMKRGLNEGFSGGEKKKDRKSTRLNSSHPQLPRMPSSAGKKKESAENERRAREEIAGAIGRRQGDDR